MSAHEAILPNGGSLPELSISASMRSAAGSIAACFHAYQYSCYDLPNARDKGQIPQNLQAQRDRKQAYHLALKFLSTATFKENPDYNIENHININADDHSNLDSLLTSYLEKKLNQLIREEAQKIGQISNQADNHPVITGPW